jgi:hypothetical protein
VRSTPSLEFLLALEADLTLAGALSLSDQAVRQQAAAGSVDGVDSLPAEIHAQNKTEGMLIEPLEVLSVNWTFNCDPRRVITH